MLTETIDAVFPSWLVRLDTSPTSRDPLGLAAQAGRHADAILPGLTVFTSRARYLSFLCWAIRASEGGPVAARLDRIHRLERLLVLSEALLHEDDPDACTYIGRRRGRRFVLEHDRTDVWELPSRVLKNQVTNGAFRLYRTALASFGLVEEVEGEEAGVGLALTSTGASLASHYERKLDATIVRWALAEPEQRKRRPALVENAKGMCLSGRIGSRERRRLIDAMVGRSGEQIVRRETVRVLFRHDLLARPPLVDIAAEDADAIVDDDGRPAEQAAAEETRGNWGVVRRILEIGPRPELRALYEASAYEMVALGLNRLFASCLDAIRSSGRMSIGAWGERVGAHVGDAYARRPAAEWASGGTVTGVANALLSSESPWEETAARAMRLLVLASRSDAIRSALADVPVSLAARVLDMAGETSARSSAQLAKQLVTAAVEHHLNVSAAKGKGEWISLDRDDLVRGDPRSLLPILHALRFAQLAQLARDVDLSREEVADEA